MARMLLALAVLALVVAAILVLWRGPVHEGLRVRAATPVEGPQNGEADLRDVAARSAREVQVRFDAPSRVDASTGVAARARRVSVFDRVDGRHLAGIEIWRSDGPLPRRSSSGRRVSKTLGPSRPSGSDERLLADLASPFELDLGERAPAALWIVADGYVPFRFIYPLQAADDVLWVHLERACGLELRLIGAHVDPEEARVRLYGPRHAEPEGDWHEQRLADRDLRFAWLEPGSWCATLEQRVGEHDRWTILAQARAELAPGEWGTLVLDALAPEAALEPAILTLRFPPAWVDEPGASARLVTGPGNSRRQGEGHELEAAVEPTWGPLGLVPGRYWLELEPGCIGLPIDLAPGERRELDVPEIRWCDVAIRLADADGEALELDWLGWGTALDWNGGPAQGSASPIRMVQLGPRMRVRAAAAPLELMFFSRRLAYARRMVVDPCSARELEVRLPKESILELALDGLEGELDIDWLARLRLMLDGEAVEAAGTRWNDDGEFTIATLVLERPGSFDLEFPPLSSHGSLRPRRVSLRAGETVRVTLGPEDLLSSARAR